VVYSGYAAFCCYNVQRVLQSIQNTDQVALPGGSGSSKQPCENSAADAPAASAKSKNVVTSSVPSSKENSSSSGATSSTSPPTEMLVYSTLAVFTYVVISVCFHCFDAAKFSDA